MTERGRDREKQTEREGRERERKRRKNKYTFYSSWSLRPVQSPLGVFRGDVLRDRERYKKIHLPEMAEETWVQKRK